MYLRHKNSWTLRKSALQIRDSVAHCRLEIMAQLTVVDSTSVLAALVVVYGAALVFYRLYLLWQNFQAPLSASFLTGMNFTLRF
jgi:hypothetical protein